ncbi:MAG: hypothetical protein SV375_21610 [Thermodesulfobacteriota bacterium]|nr:hypothetical protein [Thermodesulfobacteriota bacterium]
MKQLQTILFPHSYLSEITLKKIIPVFSTLTIFQPWFMDRPYFLNDLKSIQVLNPPDEFRPENDFKSLLSEYQDWMKRNQDKGYTESFKVHKKIDSTENTTWNIRQAIRRIGANNLISEKEHAVKWHLILHLAQALENQRLEADRLLSDLKEKKSPLQELIEDTDEVKNLFDDLPQFESELNIDQNNLEQIIGAWFALFDRYLMGNELLITLNRHIMDYVIELDKNYRIENKAVDPPVIEFKFPDLSHHTFTDLVKINKEHNISSKISELKNIILDLGTSSTLNFTELHQTIKEVEASCLRDLSDKTINIMLKYFSPISGIRHLERGDTLELFFNKTIILMEDDFSNG